MRVVYRHANPERCSDTLAILLPGALQQPEDLIEAGFVDAVSERGLPLDVSLVDLQLNFVGDAIDAKSLQRLHDDVLEPARQRGYSKIWLAGISIGGFMALAYASRHAACVVGLCLIAPYPGSRLLINEVRAAGGIRNWTAADSDDDLERCVWRWLQSPTQSPEIYFGFGEQDRFASGQQLMMDAISDGTSNSVLGAFVETVDGTHDLPAWRQLWGNFLDRIAPRLQHDSRKDAA
ncbi:MAG TPA: alpha/beta hydrolase [Noviherbaspirillum sp.]|nr:alpha/beta hydrolase [Noviherbaspirillum sp.]